MSADLQAAVSAVVVAPPDSITATIARQLERSPAVSACRALTAGEVAATDPGPGAVLVYRPSFAAPRSARPDLGEAEALLRWCAAGKKAARVILLSSTRVHSPDYHNPRYLRGAPRPRNLHPVSRTWRDLESLAGEWLAEAGIGLLILRPAPVLARDLTAAGSDPFSWLLAGRSAVVPAGYDPEVQLLDPEDLAAAVAAAVEEGAGKAGPYPVAADPVTVRRMLRRAKVRRWPVPAGPANRGDSLRDWLRHPWMVSGVAGMIELGLSVRHTSAEAVLRAFGPPGWEGTPQPGTDRRQDLIRAYSRPLFRFLHDVYWRVEHEGLENVPLEGPAVLVGVHRGFMPFDGVMTAYLLGRELGRYPRFLVHPCLVKLPFLTPFLTRLGGVVSCPENVDWVLGRNEILGVYPEGIRGAFTPYRDAYRIGKLGRDEFVRMALRKRAPIVPFVTVGSAEIYPILGRLDWKWWQRLTEWPYFPLCPNFPVPGLPLPSKWHTRFLAPLHVQKRHPPEAAEDPAVVRKISAEVRRRLEGAMGEILARRRSIFFGSVFTAGSPEQEEA